MRREVDKNLSLSPSHVLADLPTCPFAHLSAYLASLILSVRSERSRNDNRQMKVLDHHFLKTLLKLENN